MTRTKTMLLIGAAVLVAGGGFVLAHEVLPGMHHHGRMISELSHMMDKDGKVTHAEFDKMLADRFAELSGGSDTMTAEQFAAGHGDGMAKHGSAMFARLDWNSDGKISPDEFTAAERARFQRMNRDGSGVISCGKEGEGAHADALGPPPDRDAPHHGGWMHRGHEMMDRHFCADNDLNKDGKVTRVEFDSGIAKRFAEISGASGGISQDQLAAELARRGHEVSEHRFQHLDTNSDGKLTLAEFSAPEERMFAYFDKNKDGVITKDELPAHFQHRHDQEQGGHWGHADAPQG